MAEGSSNTPKRHPKGKQPVPAASPTWPKTKEEFMKWFWNGSNGNLLIKDLNVSTYRSTDFIRRESLPSGPLYTALFSTTENFPIKKATLSGNCVKSASLMATQKKGPVTEWNKSRQILDVSTIRRQRTRTQQ